METGHPPDCQSVERRPGELWGRPRPAMVRPLWPPTTPKRPAGPNGVGLLPSGSCHPTAC